MSHFKILLLACVLSALLTGCSSGLAVAYEDVPEPVPKEEPAKEREVPAAPAAPGKEEVLTARERALEGMAPERVRQLEETVKTANLWLEHGYLNDNIFGKLEDPESLYWNYLDQTGEIQIGWAVDGGLDMETVCAQEGFTETEFYNKYGTKVVVENRHGADDFIALMKELEESAQDQDLKAVLRGMAEEMGLAKGHVMEHVNNVYKTLHDLDYFLLRYGPEVLDSYQSDYDKSIVSKYYGALPFYSEL